MEKEKILKSGHLSADNAERRQAEGANPELVEAREGIAKGLNLLNEDTDVMGMGNVSENDENSGEKPGESFGSGQSANDQAKVAQVKALPSVEVMIKETASAIEAELEKRVEETERMRKSNKYSNSELNDSVKQIRHLNGLLVLLKNAAKLAEDFVVGLWKQFVKKA